MNFPKLNISQNTQLALDKQQQGALVTIAIAGITYGALAIMQAVTEVPGEIEADEDTAEPIIEE